MGLTGQIEKTWSAGRIESAPRWKGGLVALRSGRVESSCWDTQTNGLNHCNGGAGLTTSQMYLPESFPLWDFSADDGDEPDWLIRPASDYPRLAWETLPPGDIAGPWGVELADWGALVANWLEEGCPADCQNADIASLGGDGVVNILDFAWLSGEWLTEN